MNRNGPSKLLLTLSIVIAFVHPVSTSRLQAGAPIVVAISNLESAEEKTTNRSPYQGSAVNLDSQRLDDQLIEFAVPRGSTSLVFASSRLSTSSPDFEHPIPAANRQHRSRGWIAVILAPAGFSLIARHLIGGRTPRVLSHANAPRVVAKSPALRSSNLSSPAPMRRATSYRIKIPR